MANETLATYDDGYFNIQDLIDGAKSLNIQKYKSSLENIFYKSLRNKILFEEGLKNRIQYEREIKLRQYKLPDIQWLKMKTWLKTKMKLKTI